MGDSGTGGYSTDASRTDGPRTDGPLRGVGCGTGLTGLRERLAAAGGSLTAGPARHGGFTVTAELPADTGQSDGAADPAGARQPYGAGAPGDAPRPYPGGEGSASSLVKPVAGAVPSGPAGPTLGP